MKQINALGVGFVILGIIILLIYGLYIFLMSEEIPYFVRIGAILLVIGLVIVLLSLIRERVQEIKGIKPKEGVK